MTLKMTEAAAAKVQALRASTKSTAKTGGDWTFRNEIAGEGSKPGEWPTPSFRTGEGGMQTNFRKGLVGGIYTDHG